jgi:hypothetical protein
MMKFLPLFLTFLVITIPTYVSAQENDAATRLDLAREYHEYRPVKPQIDRAIENVAGNLPENTREEFTLAMQRMLNYPAIESLSVEIMADIYTTEELEAMVAYYKQPIAQAAADKAVEYQKRLGPEIVKILDRAMMEIRTGGSAP